MGKDSVVSYLCTGGRSTSVCICVHVNVYTHIHVVFTEFYTRLFLNTHQGTRSKYSLCMSVL